MFDPPSPLGRRPVRDEHDALGVVSVPASRLWGAATERARLHFAIGGDEARRWPRVVIRAFGMVKRAAAETNQVLGEIDGERAKLILAAATKSPTAPGTTSFRWACSRPARVRTPT